MIIELWVRKDVKVSVCDYIWKTCLSFAWQNWVKPRNILVKTDGLRVKISYWDVRNTMQSADFSNEFWVKTKQFALIKSH